MPGTEYGMAVDLVSDLGALGVVFWLVFRTFSHTIPRLSNDFKTAVKESRDDFKETLREQRADYHTAIEAQQNYFADQIAKEREQTEKVAEAFERLIQGGG